MGVAVLLMGLLMPAMSQVRENAHRIVCSSNQRQIGQGLFTYAAVQKKDSLPFASALRPLPGENARPEDLMSVRVASHSFNTPNGWDGLGLLFQGDYCGAGQCFYCPSHRGNNPYERYARLWQRGTQPGNVVSNFHYCGDIDWETRQVRTLSNATATMVLVTDGLRSTPDFNHETGMNVLRGDGSVVWRNDGDRVAARLPASDSIQPDNSYPTLWNSEIEGD